MTPESAKKAGQWVWSWCAIGIGYLWGSRGFIVAAEAYGAILVVLLALYGALAYAKREQ